MTSLTLPAAGPMMASVTAPRDPAWMDTTLAPDVIAYLTYMAPRMAEKTLRNRLNLLANMCETLDGWHLSCDAEKGCPRCLSGKQGRAVLDEKLVRGAWKDVQASSMGTYITALKAFFGWAYDEELVARDPTRRLDKPKPRERRHSLFTLEEESRLLAAQPFERDRVALMLHFEFAMRATDLRLLQLGDIELDRRAVRLKHGKGGTDRTLAFRTPHVFEAVNAYLTLDRRGEGREYLLYPMQSHTHGHYTFGLEHPAQSRSGEPYREPLFDRDSEGKRQATGRWTEYTERRTGRLAPFSESGLRWWWGKCLERAGLPHRRPHDARHTTGTRMVGEKKKDFRTVSKFLRHANLNTTELYVHLNELEMMRDELWEGE